MVGSKTMRLANRLIDSAALSSVANPEDFRQRYISNNAIQRTGLLLTFPQVEIARAMVFYQQFVTISDVKNLSPALIAAVLVLSVKQSGFTPRIDTVLTIAEKVLLELGWSTGPCRNTNMITNEDSQVATDSISPSSEDPEEKLQKLADMEAALAAYLDFDLDILMPYTLFLPYLQLLNLSDWTQKVWSVLNDAVRTCPYLLLMHQPNTVACAAIKIYSDKRKAVISNYAWYHLFDVTKADLDHAAAMIRYGFSYNLAC